MSRRVIRFALCAAPFIVAASSAAAYDKLTEDFETCTKGNSRTQAPAMVKACSRLIENSKVENELVGMFHAMRASVNTDKRKNCSDARKAVALIKSAKMLASARNMERVLCK